MTSLALGFINHAWLAVTPDVKKFTEVDHQPNRAESWGDGALWPTYRMPKALANLLRDPKFWTVVFTGGALFGNTVLFYPTKTWEAVRRTMKVLDPYVQAALPYARFSLWALTSSQITALGLRSLGRFGNKALMNAWYQKLQANHN